MKSNEDDNVIRPFIWGDQRPEFITNTNRLSDDRNIEVAKRLMALDSVDGVVPYDVVLDELKNLVFEGIIDKEQADIIISNLVLCEV